MNVMVIWFLYHNPWKVAEENFGESLWWSGVESEEESHVEPAANCDFSRKGFTWNLGTWGDIHRQSCVFVLQGVKREGLNCQLGLGSNDSLSCFVVLGSCHLANILILTCMTYQWLMKKFMLVCETSFEWPNKSLKIYILNVTISNSKV